MNIRSGSRGRPRKPPSAHVGLAGHLPEDWPPEARQWLGNNPIWVAAAFSRAGLRLSAPHGGQAVDVGPRALRALADMLRRIRGEYETLTSLEMDMAWDSLRVSQPIWVDGEPQVSVTWLRSAGVLLVGGELEQLAAVADIAADFATEWMRYPDPELWQWEFAQVPGVEVLNVKTVAPLPRRKQTSGRVHAAA